MDFVEDKKVTSRNIQNAFQEFAQENFLPLKECDFKLLKVDTFIKTTSSKEFELFAQQTIKSYEDREKILNEHVEFEQRYELLLFEKKECKIKLNYTIDFSQNNSHPKIVLSPDSIIPHKLHTPKALLKILYLEFNKIKAYNNILLYVFDEAMKKQLKILVKYIYTKKFTKKVKISLFEGIKPVITRKSKLIFWYKEKEKENSQVTEVDENELLIEYKKPIYGKNGLDAFGNILSVKYVQNIDDLETKIDEESILIKEDANSKRYIAKKKGFVHFDNKWLCVNNKISLRKISRNAPAISTQENSNIEVTISQYDTNRDSIGEGVTLKSETIHVDGFVGAKSLLEANSLEIEGATHQESQQFAKYAQINRHKGKLRAHHAKIALLEGGEVHATKVDIESCLGGSVYAKDVTIGHVKNNLKVYASHSITIKLISGEDNLLEIGYENIPILKSKIEFIKSDIEDLKYKLEEASRHDASKVQPLKKKIALLKDEIQTITDSYKNASIDIEQPCRGLNHIVFTLPQGNELSYKTEAKKYSTFYLELSENKITLHPVNKSLEI